MFGQRKYRSESVRGLCVLSTAIIATGGDNFDDGAPTSIRGAPQHVWSSGGRACGAGCTHLQCRLDQCAVVGPTLAIDVNLPDVKMDVKAPEKSISGVSPT
eukprot:2303676-Prymnesium_polylepis.2